jgi:hypothetical protein
MSSPAWYMGKPVWHFTYSGGMEYWWRGIPEVQLFSAAALLDAVAALVGSSDISTYTSLLLSPNVYLVGNSEVTSSASSILFPVASLNGDSTISPDVSLLAAVISILEGNAVIVADIVPGAVLDAVAFLLGSSEKSAVPQLLLSPSAYMSGSSEIKASPALLMASMLALEGDSVLTVVANRRMVTRAYLSGDSHLLVLAVLAPVTVTANTRILSGALVLLDVLADVRGAYPDVAAIRQGKVHPTFTGPVPQYGHLARSNTVVEVDIPLVTSSQIAVIDAMLRGDYGDVFTIESPRETFQASLIPGKEGVAVELYPSAPGFTKARAILRFVRVVS